MFFYWIAERVFFFKLYLILTKEYLSKQEHPVQGKTFTGRTQCPGEPLSGEQKYLYEDDMEISRTNLSI